MCCVRFLLLACDVAMLDVVFLFDENLAIGCQRQINLAS